MGRRRCVAAAIGERTRCGASAHATRRRACGGTDAATCARVHSRGIGHLTRLAVGMDVHLRKWLQLTFEFSYRFYNLPMLKLAETDALGYDFHSLNLQAGLWFGR